MNITIIALGSRGDTQPYVALALGLQRAGHSVRLCAGDNFQEFVTGYGIDFLPIGVDIQHFINTRIPQVLESGRNIMSAIRQMSEEGTAAADIMWKNVQIACEGCDVICANILGIGAACIAQQRHLPCFLLHTMPLIGRTRTVAPIFLSQRWKLGGSLNLLLHDMTEGLLKQMLRQPINQWRAAAGVPPLPRGGWRFDSLPGLTVPMLYAYSVAIVPRPADWLPHWQATGYWFLDAPPTWQPSADLVNFLEAGDPPVYIGFGSIANRRPEHVTRIVLDALKQTGQRGILATGWGGLAQIEMPDTVFCADAIPHDWLFPRVSAVVHHGGAGTTAAGFRAGVPTIVVPHLGDQFYWGSHAERLGVGVRPIPHKRLTVERLADAIRQVTSNSALRQRAASLGAAIRAEDGVGTAVRLIAEYRP